MKRVYCSNCGMPLEVTRKAMPKYNTIIDIVDPHECTGEVQELNLKSNPVPTFDTNTPESERKFANGLDTSPSVDTEALRDRRSSEHTKQGTSTAPRSVLSAVKGLSPSKPEHQDVEPEND